MTIQCHQQISQFIRSIFSWIGNIPNQWVDIVEFLNNYKPKLFYLKVAWKPTHGGRLICNTDGASKGNPSLSAYGFCLRDGAGNLVNA